MWELENADARLVVERDRVVEESVNGGGLVGEVLQKAVHGPHHVRGNLFGKKIREFYSKKTGCFRYKNSRTKSKQTPCQSITTA